MAIQVGDTLPTVPVKYIGPDGMAETDTAALTADKTVVIFAVPGAFTPTCSAQHLPGFAATLDEFAAKGVDRVICMAVNDPFVMKAWNERDGSDDERLFMLPDGNGTFTQALGLDLDGSGGAMGLRSQRFAMIVKDSVVTHLAIDPRGTFEATSAQAILKAL